MTLTYHELPPLWTEQEVKTYEDPLKEIKVIGEKLRYHLFDIWKEEDDLTLHYFLSIPSYTDYDLLM